MLTVTLVATFAAAAMWQQYRAVEVETAERARVQSAWILTGALDWSRLILREDARAGGADHLAEPWAVPLQEARLSTFLAADKSGVADAAEGPGNAFLSGEIVDLQSRLNVTNLVEAGTVSQTGLRMFQRLFELLGLPASQAALLAENLRMASEIGGDSSAGSQVPLLPQQVEQLLWVGLPSDVVKSLAPYITVLPARTPVNLNTASAEVIAAAVSGMGLADAQRLVAERASSHLRSLADASRLLPAHAQALTEGTVGVNSRYFEVRGRLRLDQVVVEERSLLFRDGTLVTTLQRERGVAGTAAAAQASPLR
jgi:general secretion pathway protein K